MILLRNNADGNLKDNAGDTPMVVLARENSEKAATVAGTIINRGIDWNSVNALVLLFARFLSGRCVSHLF